MLRILFVILVALHGLIHLSCFVKAYQPVAISRFTHEISKPAGLLWLAASLLFILSALLFLLKRDSWWIAAVAALALSQVLIVLSWHDVKYGTVVNIGILFVSLTGYGSWQFNRMTDNEIRAFMQEVKPEEGMLTNEKITCLPPVVRKWLTRSQVIDKPLIQSVYLTQEGMIRTTPDGRWMPVTAEQRIRTEQPGFIWKARVKAAPGLHLAGRDRYVDGRGHMLITLLSLFPVADARGQETNQGSMLRYLAEIIWAPTAAVNKYLSWEQVDSLTARATMNYGEINASGLFRFDQNGDVMSFEAMRYYDRKEGYTLENWYIQVEPDGYREFEGIRIPARASITWKLEEGDFTWFRLEVKEMRYNICQEENPS